MDASMDTSNESVQDFETFVTSNADCLSNAGGLSSDSGLSSEDGLSNTGGLSNEDGFVEGEVADDELDAVAGGVDGPLPILYPRMNIVTFARSEDVQFIFNVGEKAKIAFAYHKGQSMYVTITGRKPYLSQKYNGWIDVYTSELHFEENVLLMNRSYFTQQ